MNFSDALVRVLRTATRVAVLTGAGISAESGVPTFREAQTGLWAQYDPQELATPQAFARDPKLVWDWYAWRRKLVMRAQPNAGHVALVALATRFKAFTLITQNVDGLHQRAGSSAVLELHGNIMRTICAVERTAIDPLPHTTQVPPPCPRCGQPARPDVVWFGESLPRAALATAVEAAQHCEVFFSIGTSALVEPAASIPRIALERGATVIEINPIATPLTPHVQFALVGAAGEVLPNLLKLI